VIRRLKRDFGRILILRTGNLGDTACALPALAALRKNFPQAHCALLTSPGRPGLPQAAELLEGLGLVDEIFGYYPKDLQDRTFLRNLLNTLRRRRFDLFILLPQGRASFTRLLRDLGFAYLLGVKGALGFTLAHHFPLFDPRRLKDYIPPETETQRLLSLLRDAGINSHQGLPISLPESCQRKAEDLLRPFLPTGSRPVIGFQVKAKAQAKQWPMANFLELGHRLEAACKPVFVLFGGPDEADDLNRFASTFPGDKLVAAGKTSVLESLALLSHCDVLITLDTGPMHLAPLVKTPIVALFSARVFRKMWEPWSEDAVVLRKDVPCKLCFREKCELGSCMEAITVDEVYEATVNRIYQMNSE
jgi:ADP-heptose:LPS heptosyltransferase